MHRTRTAKELGSYLLILLKDFGTLFGYTFLFLLITGVAQYFMYCVAHWSMPGTGFGSEGLGDDLFFKAAECIILLAFFARRRTLRLNYTRILHLKPALVLHANRGFAFATLSIVFITGLMMAFGAVHLAYNPAYSLREVLLYFLLFILVGFSEEFLMRGIWVEYLLKRHSKAIAVIISSLVFACLHLGNPGVTLLAFVNLILAGVILAQLYLFTKNLWLAVFFHLGWNFFQGPVLGFAVSGLPMHSIFLQPANITQNLLNGGSFGLEGSVIETMVTALMAVGLGVALWRRPKKHSSINTTLSV